ncbi:hypothetical protein DM01DRAFT_1286778, partial [Hesseltinella vesiculosa]
MHNLFLGTAKKITRDTWSQQTTDGITGVKKPALLSAKILDQMERDLYSLLVPPTMRLSRRKIASGFAQLTADDWRKWTLGISQCLIHGRGLGASRVVNWMMFVDACRLIVKPTVTINEAEEAHMASQFGKSSVTEYGSTIATINMHLHCHLLDNIKDFGPIYAFWCFGFERYNGRIKKITTNNKDCFELTYMARFNQQVHRRDYVQRLP